VTGIEIFDRIIFGHTVFKRDRDAYDLIDEDGLVCAVLCRLRADREQTP
jgi:hypothetical protein